MSFSLVYTPDVDMFESGVDFVCSDNRVHFRFRDFVKNEHIQGFERKLIYLMEYLYNFCYTPSFTVNTLNNKEKILEDFLNSDDVKDLTRIISTFVCKNRFKGLKAYFNYNKKEDCKPFGEINETYFPSVGDNSLLNFQKKLKINISDFLFNDRYSIILHEENSKDVNKKFKNKNLNNNQEDDYVVKLW